MPIHRTSDGKWQWGKSGKKYASRKGAERQAQAAHANGYRGMVKALPDRIAEFVNAQKKKERKVDNKPKMPYNDSPLINM